MADMIIATKNYDIVCGKEWSRKLNALLQKKKFSSFFILCDENTFRLCLPQLITQCAGLSKAEIIEIEPGEGSKGVEVAVNIWQTLSENEADRHSLLINLGGGVVTDLGGFCASVYKRGISFVNIPTTLLAMADASVGSKTGVDFAGIKNLLGTFKSPEGVFINPEFLETLPLRHHKNGLAEIFKIALVSDKRFWASLQRSNGKHVRQVIIEHSIILKKKIVQKDPLDQGPRKVLNFGHSIGHAIESAAMDTGSDLLHGEAVLIGIVVEAHIAFQKKLITKKTLQEIIETLRPLMEGIDIPAIDTITLIELIRNDKKAADGKLFFALINGIGSCKPQVEVTPKQITSAIEFYKSFAA
jgi:3-dehydroquinate synthase